MSVPGLAVVIYNRCKSPNHREFFMSAVVQQMILGLSIPKRARCVRRNGLRPGRVGCGRAGCGRVGCGSGECLPAKRYGCGDWCVCTA